MLEGKGKLSLPAYDGRLPAVVIVRCLCSLRYCVLTGAHVEGCKLVKLEVERRGLVFVDARSEPFKLCGCGQVLDFSSGEAAALVM